MDDEMRAMMNAMQAQLAMLAGENARLREQVEEQASVMAAQQSDDPNVQAALMAQEQLRARWVDVPGARQKVPCQAVVDGQTCGLAYFEHHGKSHSYREKPLQSKPGTRGEYARDDQPEPEAATQTETVSLSRAQYDALMRLVDQPAIMSSEGDVARG